MRTSIESLSTSDTISRRTIKLMESLGVVFRTLSLFAFLLLILAPYALDLNRWTKKPPKSSPWRSSQTSKPLVIPDPISPHNGDGGPFLTQMQKFSKNARRAGRRFMSKMRRVWDEWKETVPPVALRITYGILISQTLQVIDDWIRMRGTRGRRRWRERIDNDDSLPHSTSRLTEAYRRARQKSIDKNSLWRYKQQSTGSQFPFPHSRSVSQSRRSRSSRRSPSSRSSSSRPHVSSGPIQQPAQNVLFESAFLNELD